MTAAGDWVCGFCGMSGERTKEHVIPQWLHKGLGPLPSSYLQAGMQGPGVVPI